MPLGDRTGGRERASDLTAEKKQRRHYSGKKKQHTLKSQLVVDRATGLIICVAVGKGRRHDFHLFKASGVQCHSRILVLAHSGYQGLQKQHANTALPKRRSKKNSLDHLDKALNHVISSQRVLVENVIRRVKVFRIMGERYRNRQKRFGLRLNLIAGMLNAQL